MNKRKSNGSTAQCGGPAAVLLNLQHHIQSRGQCYTLATVPLGKLTKVSRVGPRVSLHAVVKRKFPPTPKMNSKCLAIQHIWWLSHLTSFVCRSQHKEWLLPQILSNNFCNKTEEYVSPDAKQCFKYYLHANSSLLGCDTMYFCK